MSRLSIEISQEQHQQIKALAALQGKSIKELILGKLFTNKGNDEQAAWEELENLLVSRIEQAKQSGSTGKTFEQITAEALQARNHQ